MTDEAVRLRIDQLEAMVNGLITYIAAKEVGIVLDTDDEKTRAFLRAKVARPQAARLQTTGAIPGDGYYDAVAIVTVDKRAEELKSYLG